MNSELAGLRDIHLPGPISWWPPAFGWWLLLVLLGVLLVSAWCLRARISGALHRARVYRSALRELQALQTVYRASGDSLGLVRELSIWLRRVLLSLRPRSEVAGLSGAAWLAELDRMLPDRPFSHGPGKVFAEAPYRAATVVDVQTLLSLCQRWLRMQLRAGGKRP